MKALLYTSIWAIIITAIFCALTWMPLVSVTAKCKLRAVKKFKKAGPNLNTEFWQIQKKIFYFFWAPASQDNGDYYTWVEFDNIKNAFAFIQDHQDKKELKQHPVDATMQGKNINGRVLYRTLSTESLRYPLRLNEMLDDRERSFIKMDESPFFAKSSGNSIHIIGAEYLKYIGMEVVIDLDMDAKDIKEALQVFKSLSPGSITIRTSYREMDALKQCLTFFDLDTTNVPQDLYKLVFQIINPVKVSPVAGEAVEVTIKKDTHG